MAPNPPRLRFRFSALGKLSIAVGLLSLWLLGPLLRGGWNRRIGAAFLTATLLDGLCSWWAMAQRRPLQVTLSAPPDAVVGQTDLLAVSVSGAPRKIVLGLVKLTSWLRVDVPDRGELLITHHQRGLFTHAVVTLAHSAPLGLVSAVRVVPIALAQPAVVAPNPSEVPGFRLPRPTADYEATDARVSNMADLVRGARPYVPGDSMRHVHWPATARSGGLMVREWESLHSPNVVVVADLGPYPGPPAERAAGRASAVASQALRAGLAVTLVTVEIGALVVREVHSPLEIGRRLALSVPSVPPVATSKLGHQIVATLPGSDRPRPCIYVSPRGVWS